MKPSHFPLPNLRLTEAEAYAVWLQTFSPSCDAQMDMDEAAKHLRNVRKLIEMAFKEKERHNQMLEGLE